MYDGTFEIVNESITESIIKAFDIPQPDTYLYSQESSTVTIQQAADALRHGSKYHYYQNGRSVEIPRGDIDAYIQLFAPESDPEGAYASFLANAKKESPRKSVAGYLVSRRVLDTLNETPTSSPDPTKKKSSKQKNKRKKLRGHENPYFSVWSLMCRQLGFLGPLPGHPYSLPASARQAHPILPIFMHHFGCAIPSYEALHLILQTAGSSFSSDPSSANRRVIFDIGCGNGYWTYLLRQFCEQHGLTQEIVAVDDGSSTWRTTWIDHLVRQDALEFLQGRDTKEAVMLLVYPVTSQNFTRRAIGAFHGNTICLVGTQNENRYTAFDDATVEEFCERGGAWKVTSRLPLPSFPGKDDALYILRRI